MDKNKLETEDGYICPVCGQKFLTKDYQNIPQRNPKRVAFYQAVYHKCSP